jgi:RNA polymerase sigma factor (sigma-70 family)
MRASESVTHWLPGVRTGDGQALTQLWSRYYQRLVLLARRRLGPAHHGLCDEEDIAAEAMHSFFRRARNGSFPELGNREDLWRLLAAITKRKAISQLRRDRRQLDRAVREGESLGWESGSDDFSRAGEHGWTAEDQVCFRETLSYLLAGLNDDLRQIAVSRLQGYTLVEIAAQIGRSVPTVERRLRVIRERWRRLGVTIS